MTMVLVNTVVASAATRNVLVSRADLYRTCITPGSPGTNYPNTEIEPRLALNPANAENLIGAWQQDRWSSGGARGLVAGYSLNGGRTWAQSAIPFTLCSPGGVPFGRASDPWVSIGPDGRAYAVGLVSCFTCSGIIASTSADGGRTWSSASFLLLDTNTAFSNDKPSITADPRHAGTAYAIWDRLDFRHRSCVGPAVMSRTTDGGRHWTSPTSVVPERALHGNIGNVITVDPRDGTLYDVFNAYAFDPTCSTNSPGTESMTKSTDGGVTWSPAVVIGQNQSVPPLDPNTRQGLRSGTGLPAFSINSSTGQLYVAWEDARFSGGRYNEIALTTSRDRGLTWSPPTRVSDATGRLAFTPSIAVEATGDVGVSYFDLRALGAGNVSSIPTQYWLTILKPDGNTKLRTTQITDGPFDLASAPQSGGFFLGDYQGLVARGAQFEAFYARTAGAANNPTDIYSATLPG